MPIYLNSGYSEQLGNFTTDDLPEGSTNKYESDPQAFTTQALTFAANVSWDASSGHIATLTVTGDCTVDNPTNLTAGREYWLEVTQDGVGGHTVDFGTAFLAPNGVTKQIDGATSEANAVVLLKMFSFDGTDLRLHDFLEYAA